MKKLPNYLKRSTAIWEIDVDSIIVPTGRRTAGDDPLLADSIRALGLIHPISVSPELILICGARRLDQYKRLGWKTIPARIKDYDEIDRELAELEENLTHAGEPYLKRIKQLKRHKELYEAKYPESRHGNTTERAAVKRTGGVLPPPFTKVAGENWGVSQRKIQRDIKLAGRISDEAADKIWNKKIADKPKELTRLAKHDYETQLKLADEIQLERANDVKRAELNLQLDSSNSSASLSNFFAKIRAIWFELDQSNQSSEFQNAVHAYPNVDELVDRIESINELLSNWVEYYERSKPRQRNAA